MKWCERCGGPCRPLKYQVHPVDGHNGCRMCALEDVALWGVMDRHLIADGPAVTEPCPHASGWWLPPNTHPRELLGSSSDEDRLMEWLWMRQPRPLARSYPVR
jgi:hypothetical protein